MLRRMFLDILVVGGWILFVFEWIRVSHFTARTDAIILVVGLILSILLIHGGAYVWIGHNKRLAARGRRRTITPYASPGSFCDHLGRKLVIDQQVYQSKEIVISIEGDIKNYNAAEILR